MSKTKIEWADRVWNPVTGCTKVSQGCKNCYAERMYERFNGHGSFKNVICHSERLAMPHRWKEPQRVFVNSMSDLFHEAVPFEFINAVFSVMGDISLHTYMVLTKRPARMLEFIEWKSSEFNLPWGPPSNVWLGVSVEDQKSADERIPLLLQVPSSVRFISCEPLLGALKFTFINIVGPTGNWIGYHDVLAGNRYSYDIGYKGPAPKIHWVIAGGESGPGARPMHPDWVRSIRDQCEAAHTPFFFKQWGNYLPFEATAQMPFYRRVDTLEEFDAHHMDFIDSNGDAGKFMGYRWLDTFETYLMNEEMGNRDCTFLHMGKGKAGHLLDGKLHTDFPFPLNTLT